MNLKFKGFLRGYVRELTGLETDNLKKQLAAVLGDAPAAAEALMLFAAVQGRSQYLAKLAQDTFLAENYLSFSEAAEEEGDLAALLESSDTPQRYQKVWQAYLSKKDAVKADRRVIALMREKTIDAMQNAELTVYGLCKQLGLNAGNVYAYLNGGDVTKVSRSTARRIMEAALAAR